MGRADRIYASLPVWGQHTALSAYGFYWRWARFGKGYRHALKGYLEREWFTPAQWEEWQGRRLRQVLTVASAHVPYYADTWTASEKAGARAGRLAEVPPTDKDPIRRDPELFIRRDLSPRPRFTFHTSGSSGTPVAAMCTLEELRVSMALREARSARWADTSFRMPRATFSGRIVQPDPDAQEAVYRFNLAERQVYFSAFHLGPRTAHLYVDALARHGSRWITGYAVSAYLLAGHILDQSLAVPDLEAVVTTSEKVTDQMRRVMQEAYGCPIYEEYSTVENAVFASECSHGRLHVSPDACVIEIVRPDGSSCEPGEIGEVVATTFIRDYQPLIRYRLGDLAAWHPDPCPCGRAMPVIQEVTGRIEDVVQSPDGRQLVRFHGIFVDLPNVRYGQIVQQSLDLIQVKVVADEDLTEDDSNEMRRRVRERMGSAVDVEVHVVDEIPRDDSGKFRPVISKISVASGSSAMDLDGQNSSGA